MKSQRWQNTTVDVMRQKFFFFFSEANALKRKNSYSDNLYAMRVYNLENSLKRPSPSEILGTLRQTLHTRSTSSYVMPLISAWKKAFWLCQTAWKIRHFAFVACARVRYFVTKHFVRFNQPSKFAKSRPCVVCTYFANFQIRV